MSSSAFPFGMVPVLNYGSRYNTQGFEQLDILDGYTTAIYYGDVVKLATAGVIQKDTGTTSLTPYGVFVGCSYIDPSLGYFNNQQYWPASTTTSVTTGPGRPMAKVVTDPDAVFAIQADGTVAQTALGANAAIVQTAGSSTFGKSKNALDADSVDTTNTLPLRIVGLFDAPDNAWGDAFPILLVKWNAGVQINNTTGI